MNENYSLSDIAAVTGGGYGGGNGLFANDNWMWLFILFLFGGWGRGFGGGFGGYGGGGDCGYPAATKADIDSAFALNGLQTGVDAVQASLTSLSGQLAQCCCDNKAAIADVKYQMATDTCAITGAIGNSTRDILENANNNTRSILDFLVQDKISTLQAENQSLKLAASQANQNAVLMAAMDANTAQIIRRTGNEYPTPCFVVQPPTPVNFPNWGNGCGCGCNGFNN